jgi:hypothetical protein
VGSGSVDSVPVGAGADGDAVAVGAGVVATRVGAAVVPVGFGVAVPAHSGLGPWSLGIRRASSSQG